MNKNNQNRRSSVIKKPRSTRRPSSRPSQQARTRLAKPIGTSISQTFTSQLSKASPSFTTLPGSKLIFSTKVTFNRTTRINKILTDQGLRNISEPMSTISGRTRKPRQIATGIAISEGVPKANTLNESLLIVVLLSALFVCAAIVIVTALILKKRRTAVSK